MDTTIRTPIPFYNRISKDLLELFSSQGLVATFLFSLVVMKSKPGQLANEDAYDGPIRLLMKIPSLRQLINCLRLGRNAMMHSKMFSLELLTEIRNSLCKFVEQEPTVEIGKLLFQSFDNICKSVTVTIPTTCTFIEAKNCNSLRKGTHIRIEDGICQGRIGYFRGWSGSVCNVELEPIDELSEKELKHFALKRSFSCI